MASRALQLRAFSVSCAPAARKRSLLGASQLNRHLLAEDDLFSPLPKVESPAAPPPKPRVPKVAAIEPTAAPETKTKSPKPDTTLATKPHVIRAHSGSVEHVPADTKTSKGKKQEHQTCLYWETTPPTKRQLEAADYFFMYKPAEHIWTQAQFKKIPMSEAPEVIFMGRSNVGKSSLLNGIFNAKNLARTSKTPGATKLFHAYSCCGGKLVVLDTPGYGFKSKEEWGNQLMKYLTGRKQLRRVFVLIDALHGFKETDLAIMSSIASEGVSYQVVLSKQDRVPKGAHEDLLNKTKDLITDPNEAWSTTTLGEIVGVQASPKDRNIPKRGMNELRWAMIQACGLEEYAMKLRHGK